MNEINGKNYERVSGVYRQYAKNAALTLKQMNLKIIRLSALIFLMLFWIISNFVIMIKGKEAIGISLLLVVTGALIGAVTGAAIVCGIFSKMKTLGNIERSEGYSPRFFEEADRLTAENKMYKAATAEAYLRCGDTDKALSLLADIDAGRFAEKPSNAHIYYAALLKAHLLNGDMPKASQVYSEGFYYLKTYMNSPIYGDGVSLALGIYEYYNERYNISLGLLDNAMNILNADRKPKNRLPDENFAFTISYWKAMCFASSGNKAAAWDCINSCRGLYTTEYYRKRADKLLADMAEDENKRKSFDYYETIS